MITFDQIIPLVREVFLPHQLALAAIEQVIINRDLNGRVRFIVPASIQDNPEQLALVRTIAAELCPQLGSRSYSPERTVLFEEDIDSVKREAPSFPLAGFDNLFVVDRLVSETDWASISEESTGAPRVVFFSIKGGVGRSTALAATAWALAQAGKRVLVLDLDLESPGLSTALLPAARQPVYGITDWLVEDLLDNGDAVLDAMVSTSGLSHDGEIYVVPAHGAKPGEYVSKLGRVWMPKVGADGLRESWSQRLKRLIGCLEVRYTPDVVLIDSRAGIDEVASSCVSDLGANLVLLFAIEGSQTWTGYRILFEHWLRADVVRHIRDRLQIVAALTPELDRIDYLEGLRENAYDLFAETLYDEIPPGDVVSGTWHFETADDSAPHAPWEVKWHRSFAGLRSLHGRLVAIDADEVRGMFGPLIAGIIQTLGMENTHE